MADDEYKELLREIKDAMRHESDRTMLYIREHNGLIRAEIDVLKRSQIKFQETQEKHGIQIARNQQRAESLAEEAGAKKGAQRGFIVSLALGLIFFVLNVWVKVSG